MTQQQIEIVERAIAGFTAQDKLELIGRLRDSIRPRTSSDRVAEQLAALKQACQRLEGMPVATQEDDLTNRDHDEILYTR